MRVKPAPAFSNAELWIYRKVRGKGREKVGESNSDSEQSASCWEFPAQKLTCPEIPRPKRATQHRGPKPQLIVTSQGYQGSQSGGGTGSAPERACLLKSACPALIPSQVRPTVGTRSELASAPMAVLGFGAPRSPPRTSRANPLSPEDQTLRSFLCN